MPNLMQGNTSKRSQSLSLKKEDWLAPDLRRGFLGRVCKLGHEPVAILLVILWSLNKSFQQLDCCRCVVTIAFELGDDAILIVDLLLAESNVLLGSGENSKKHGAFHVM
jgi:hypothetical protein